MRLGAVAYIVPDYDAGIAFFTALGWSVTADEDQGRKRWVTVSDGTMTMVLARAEGSVQRKAVGRQFAGRVGFFLHAEAFEPAAARIEAAGGVFEAPPRDESYGRVAVWRDPWGTRWDLIAPA